MIIGNKYKLIEKIGEGSFSKVYKGVNIRTNELVAIKVESKDSYKKLLKNEAKILQYLNPYLIQGFNQIKWFGVDELNSYMIIDLLGLSLDKFKMKLNLVELKNIGKQMIERIKSLHSKGFIHRDIKPENFLFDCHNNIIYLIDFGICKNFSLNNDNKINNIIGTPIFVSLNVHQKGQPSLNDDIESIIFIILYLMDQLEWFNLKCNFNFDEICIQYKKEIINKEDISNNLKEIIIYCRNLKFNEIPNYEFILNILNNL